MLVIFFKVFFFVSNNLVVICWRLRGQSFKTRLNITILLRKHQNNTMKLISTSWYKQVAGFE